MAARARRLLDFIPVPLLNDLVSGRWLPVVGAGLSKNAEVRGAGSMPDWRELGERIGRELPAGYAADSPLETLSAYEYAFGRGKLTEVMQRELNVTNAHPGRVHAAFCNLQFKVVVTTNVEQLLEQGYRAKYGSVLPITEEDQLRLVNPYPSPKLVKLHGDLDHPSSLVLTEADYDRFLDRHPVFATWLASQLISNTCVLIGYSLDDPDFRSVVAQLRSRLGAVPPDLYVLDIDADPVRIDRYARRGVRTINIKSNGRGYAILEDLFAELADFWAERVPSGVTSTTTIGRMALRARTRLSRVILFLVSSSHLSDYNENVFLELTEQGLLPVTEEDIQQPEGNELASLDLLLDAANQVVVEVDQDTDPRLEYALKRVGDERVIVVMPRGQTAEDQAMGARFSRWTTYLPLRGQDWRDFSVRLIDLLRQQRSALQNEQHIIESIQTLQEDGRYQTAFLVGVVELEGRLNRALGLDDYKAKYSARGRLPRDIPRSLRGLLSAARQLELVTLTSEEIDSLTSARNQIVHGGELPRKALQILTGLVVRLLNELSDDAENNGDDPDN